MIINENGHGNKPVKQEKPVEPPVKKDKSNAEQK
jgi:hypothetical protein